MQIRQLGKKLCVVTPHVPENPNIMRRPILAHLQPVCVARSCRYLDLMSMDLDKRALKMFIRKCRFRKRTLQFIVSFFSEVRGQKVAIITKSCNFSIFTAHVCKHVLVNILT